MGFCGPVSLGARGSGDGAASEGSREGEGGGCDGGEGAEGGAGETGYSERTEYRGLES